MPTADLQDPHLIYFHVRMVMGMIVGLGLTHLLRGVARIVEHPASKALNWVHLTWVLFLYMVHFWWWELLLSAQPHWSFGVYLFLIVYALLLYLLAALLFPDGMQEYRDYSDYFLSRRIWFFGLLAFIFLIDFYDTWLKGSEYFHSRGIEYVIRNAAFILLCGIAGATRRAWFHAAFAILAVLYQLSWIWRLYDTLN
jgi:hypothetical protein